MIQRTLFRSVNNSAIFLWATFAASGLAMAELTDAQAKATSAALDLAGAFANDGYKLRDGRWSITLKPGESNVLAVHLYGGNDYWFSAAAEPTPKKLLIEVFDEEGRLMEGETYSDAGRTAAGAVPDHSGLYYVRVSLPKDEESPADVILVYSYK